MKVFEWVVLGEMSGKSSVGWDLARFPGSLNWKVAKTAVAGVEGWDLKIPGERAEAAKTFIRTDDLSKVRIGSTQVG